MPIHQKRSITRTDMQHVRYLVITLVKLGIVPTHGKKLKEWSVIV